MGVSQREPVDKLKKNDIERVSSFSVYTKLETLSISFNQLYNNLLYIP